MQHNVVPKIFWSQNDTLINASHRRNADTVIFQQINLVCIRYTFAMLFFFLLYVLWHWAGPVFIDAIQFCLVILFSCE